MSVEATAKTMRSYLDALLARGDFADYFTDDVTWTIIGTDQHVRGREPVRDFLIWMHTQAFDAHPKVKTLVVGDGQAALEADLVGIHTGEFLGLAATGKSVQVPLLRGLRPARPQDRGSSRLHPYGVVRPTAQVSSLPAAPIGHSGSRLGTMFPLGVGQPAVGMAAPRAAAWRR